MAKGLDKWVSAKAGPAPRTGVEYRDVGAKAAAASAKANAASEKGQTRGALKLHAAAGEAHLNAAKVFQKGVDAHPEKRANALKANVALHTKAAEEHASKAGDQWDEGKHPRGADGKFS